MACVKEKPSSSFWISATDVRLFQVSVALASITTVFTTVRSCDSGVSLDSSGANTTYKHRKQEELHRAGGDADLLAHRQATATRAEEYGDGTRCERRQ